MEYVHLSATRQPARTAALFVAPELNRLLILAPPEFLPVSARLTASGLCSKVVEWLA